MSQIDYIHYMPSLIWVISLFIGFYIFISTVFIPEMYKIHRVRRNYLKKLQELLKIELYTILLYNKMLQIKNNLFVSILKNYMLLQNKKIIVLLKCI